jgi:hypothetical protein
MCPYLKFDELMPLSVALPHRGPAALMEFVKFHMNYCRSLYSTVLF